MDAACWQRHPRENGQPLRIELSFIGTDALSKSMAEIIQADMRQIGADVSLIGEEESSIYARQRDGRFGMIFHRLGRAIRSTRLPEFNARTVAR